MLRRFLHLSVRSTRAWRIPPAGAEPHAVRGQHHVLAGNSAIQLRTRDPTHIFEDEDDRGSSMIEAEPSIRDQAYGPERRGCRSLVSQRMRALARGRSQTKPGLL